MILGKDCGMLAEAPTGSTTRVMEINARTTSFGDDLKLEFTPGNFNGYPFRVWFNGCVTWCEDWREADTLFNHPYA